MDQDAKSRNASTEAALVLTSDEERLVRVIVDALRRIQHGSVQLVVQDSRVVQIDTVEKTRLVNGTSRI